MRHHCLILTPRYVASTTIARSMFRICSGVSKVGVQLLVRSREGQRLAPYYFEGTPEEALVERARNGDQIAFEILICRSYHGCMQLASSILGDADEAADAVQNAFWRAYHHVSRFEGQAKFSTWVGRIVINCCLTSLDSGQRRKAVPFDSAELVMAAANRETPERLLSRKEIQALVRNEVRRIPVLLRQPLEYHHLEGLPLEQVAGRLGISVAAAKSRLNRAHECLRERIRRHCGPQGPGSLLNAA